MQVHVSGKGVDVGESLTKHVESRAEEAIAKHIDRVNDVKVVVSKEAHQFRADIHANIGTHSGMTVRSSGKSTDVYAACDDAIAKVEKQLRRYKRKLNDHHKISFGAAEVDIAGEARKYVLPADVGTHEESDEQPLSGTIIAEKPSSIDKLTVSQAVMKMDLQDLPAVLFKHAASGRLNVVYRRADGNVSWVDSAEVVAAEKVA